GKTEEANNPEPQRKRRGNVNGKMLAIILAVLVVLIVGFLVVIVVVNLTRGDGEVDGGAIEPGISLGEMMEMEAGVVYGCDTESQTVEECFEEKASNVDNAEEKNAIYITEAGLYDKYQLYEDAVTIIEKVDEVNVAEEDKQAFYVNAYNAYNGIGDDEKAAAYSQKISEIIGGDVEGEG
ncbi:MAG: hypothetical protein Q4B65_00135, partial [Candidatus Saccharibacteria bacterium]|nr:hypothetical protein [Candidatus Saccharibacteria bacterium]